MPPAKVSLKIERSNVTVGIADDELVTAGDGGINPSLVIEEADAGMLLVGWCVEPGQIGH
jgi:hypothetical protein